MTYDFELTLIDQTMSEDEVGNQIPTEVETVVLCAKKSTGRTEFYNAALNGLRPEYVFVIHAYEYEDQRIVAFDGIRYSVIRTYGTSFEELELTCERVSANG